MVFSLEEKTIYTLSWPSEKWGRTHVNCRLWNSVCKNFPVSTVVKTISLFVSLFWDRTIKGPKFLVVLRLVITLCVFPNTLFSAQIKLDNFWTHSGKMGVVWYTMCRLWLRHLSFKYECYNLFILRLILCFPTKVNFFIYYHSYSLKRFRFHSYKTETLFS